MVMASIIGIKQGTGFQESTKAIIGKVKERIIIVILNLKLESGKAVFF